MDKTFLLTTPDTPPSLNEILEKFRDSFGEQYDAELLAKLEKFKASLGNGTRADDVGLMFSLEWKNGIQKKVQLEAYIRYMGLTLYWHEKQENDAAWFYYAKAQYYLGIYDSWDCAIDHLVQKDLERQNRAKGGKSKNQKTTKPLMDALVKVVVEKKPTDGWSSKKELINAAMPAFDEIYKKLGEDSLPVYNGVEDLVYRWLRTNTEAGVLYAVHAAKSNHDWHP